MVLIEPAKFSWFGVHAHRVKDIGIVQAGSSIRMNTRKARFIENCRKKLGIDASELKFLGIFMDRYGQDGESTLNIYYWGTIRGGIPAPHSDVDEVGWFPLSSLPKVLAFDNNRQALEVLQLLLTPV